jgi:hypothetical protein
MGEKNITRVKRKNAGRKRLCEKKIFYEFCATTLRDKREKFKYNCYIATAFALRGSNAPE